MHFTMMKTEVEKALDFMKNHKCSVKYEGAAGGKFTYSFTPTGIGMAVEIECACGEKENVTDYDMW